MIVNDATVNFIVLTFRILICFLQHRLSRTIRWFLSTNVSPCCGVCYTIITNQSCKDIFITRLICRRGLFRFTVIVIHAAQFCCPTSICNKPLLSIDTFCLFCLYQAYVLCFFSTAASASYSVIRCNYQTNIP